MHFVYVSNIKHETVNLGISPNSMMEVLGFANLQ